MLLIPELLEENIKKMRIINSLVDLKLDDIFFYSSKDNLIVSSWAFKRGVIDTDMNLIIPFKYDDVIIENNLIVVGVLKHRDENNVSKYKYGVLDLNNNEILPTIYDRIEVTDNSIITSKRNDIINKIEVICYDKTGKEKFSIQGKDFYFSHGIIGIQLEDNKFEIYNENKEKIIPFSVDSYGILHCFNNCLIDFDKDNKSGIYDEFGNVVLNLDIYDNEFSFENDIVTFSKKGIKKTFLYRNGNKNLIDTNSCGIFCDELWDIYYNKELNEDKEIEFIIIEKQTLKSKIVKLGFKKEEFPILEYSDGILKLRDNDKGTDLDIIYDVKRDKIIEVNKNSIIYSKYGLISEYCGCLMNGFKILYNYDKEVIIPGIFNSINILNDEYAIVNFFNNIYADNYLLNYKKIKELSPLEEEKIKVITNAENHIYAFDLKEKKYIEIESWNLISENKKFKIKK